MRLVYLLPFVLCASVTAQQSAPSFRLDGRPAAAVQETYHLTIKTSTIARSAKPGSRISLFLDITPKPKMHVYAPGQKNYIPVSIAVGEDARIKPHPAVFPAAEKYFFKPLNETQLVYSKPFRIVQDVTLAEPVDSYTKSTLTITGTVRYQACDDEICYLPKTVPVAWTLRLTVFREFEIANPRPPVR
jgi:DsbC/DsbD-like thiol-disulfide interchange protein